MNRMLYQRSYAAIYDPPPKQQNDYIRFCTVCQVFSCIFSFFRPPAAAAAAQQPTPNRMHRIVRIALQSKSWIQNMGNLLLCIRLARTGPMISGLLPFCSHRNFHFFFTSHTTFNLHFFAMVSAKMCHRQRKNPCPQDKGCFLVTRTGLEPMLPP